MSNVFYGTKCIKAQAMTRLEYCHYRGWAVPAGEDGSDAGYLVEYVDGGAPNHPDHDGYISWSPADVFDRAYQPSGSMNFGHALMAIKDGHKVARSGWNGKGMWIAYTPGSDFPAAAARPGHAAKHRAEEVGMGGVVFLLPHIDMRAADGSMVIGWLASQTDMLAEDWMIVEGSA
ncbi:gp49 [Ruegeria sp. TrichCH4B]|nr:gp49 [Ruegeria sp. TrichCH4B]